MKDKSLEKIFRQITDDSSFFEAITKACENLDVKGSDYAEKNDRLAEFKATAKAVGITKEMVLGTYLNKHLRSVYKYIRGEELNAEGIHDKIVDVIVYMLLLYKMCNFDDNAALNESTRTTYHASYNRDEDDILPVEYKGMPKSNVPKGVKL